MTRLLLAQTMITWEGRWVISYREMRLLYHMATKPWNPAHRKERQS
jgi:hypothetical protein